MPITPGPISHIKLGETEHPFDAISVGGKGIEDIGNLVKTISNESTDEEYPSAKCIYDIIYGREFSIDYLTFEIIESGVGSLSWKCSTEEYEKTIEYKKNDDDWISLTSSTSGGIISVEKGDIIKFRGENGSYASSEYYNYFGCTLNFNIYGNIMSLIDGDDFRTSNSFSETYIFKDLFHQCTKLISAENLILAATTLVQHCYSNMFRGCTSLIKVPVLSAMTLGNGCYSGMFGGCTSLTSAPELPATTLANNCYEYMFNGCTHLSVQPVLSATTLANACYLYMFNGCSSLNVPQNILPAMTLKTDCYRCMYRGSGVTKLPLLPATTVAEAAYYKMFEDCYNLVDLGYYTLSGTTLGYVSCEAMFNGCKNLVSAEHFVLPAMHIANSAYWGMFGDCIKLEKAPQLPATALEWNAYYSMFWNCKSLEIAPDLPALSVPGRAYEYMFNGCKIKYIKCLATNVSFSNNACTGWLSGAAAEGTFVKNSDMNDWPEGNGGIPTGWTVIDDE